MATQNASLFDVPVRDSLAIDILRQLTPDVGTKITSDVVNSIRIKLETIGRDHGDGMLVDIAMVLFSTILDSLSTYELLGAADYAWLRCRQPVGIARQTEIERIRSVDRNLWDTEYHNAPNLFLNRRDISIIVDTNPARVRIPLKEFFFRTICCDAMAKRIVGHPIPPKYTAKTYDEVLTTAIPYILSVITTKHLNDFLLIVCTLGSNQYSITSNQDESLAQHIANIMSGEKLFDTEITKGSTLPGNSVIIHVPGHFVVLHIDREHKVVTYIDSLIRTSIYLTNMFKAIVDRTQVLLAECNRKTDGENYRIDSVTTGWQNRYETASTCAIMASICLSLIIYYPVQKVLEFYPERLVPGVMLRYYRFITDVCEKNLTPTVADMRYYVQVVDPSALTGCYTDESGTRTNVQVFENYMSTTGLSPTRMYT